MKTRGWFFIVLNWIALIAAGMGFIFIIIGVISAWVGRIIPGTESVNFFHAANSFFLGSMALFVLLIKTSINKEIS